jgi:hypothetical protein
MRPAWLSDTAEQVNLLVVSRRKCRALSAGSARRNHCRAVMQLGDAIKIMNDRLKPQLRVDSTAWNRRFKLPAVRTFSVQLQHRMVPSSATAIFFNALTSPSSSLMRQHPQIPPDRNRVRESLLLQLLQQHLLIVAGNVALPVNIYRRLGFVSTSVIFFLPAP